jgi:Holliday junction resolvase RusA-like endonuclease
MSNINSWSTFVNIEPISATHQSSLRILKTRSGRLFVGKSSSSKIKTWISRFESAVLSNGIPKSPIDGPIAVNISFRFSYNKSVRKRDIGKFIWKATRPDLDNMEKSILDSLSRIGVITEDKNVVSKTSEKCYCPNPGIYIHIEKLGDYLP